MAAAIFLGSALSATVRGEDDNQDIEDESLTADQLRALHGKFDQDGDGRVSLQEVLHFSRLMSREIAARDIGAILEEIDSSKDGKLSLQEHFDDLHSQAEGGDAEEMKELEQRKAVEEAKFKAADANGDGVLDADELPALFYPETHEDVLHVVAGEVLRQKDKNKDGRLSAAEFWEALDGASGEDEELTEEEMEDFNKLDLDGDGSLNLAELKAWESGRFHTEEAMRKMFDVVDKDGDMHITAQELTEAKETVSSSGAQYHLIEWVEHHEL